MGKTKQWRTCASPAGAPGLMLAWALAVAVWLSGCGPGVGGTGTGETNGLADFGATATSLCATPLGGVLGCVPGAGGAPLDPVPGAAPVFLADTSVSPRVQARVQDNHIDLTVPCTGLRFRGRWGAVDGQAPRFFGSTGQDGAQQPATLQMDLAAPGSASVVATVRDAAGGLMLSPATLVVVPAPATPAACS